MIAGGGRRPRTFLPFWAYCSGFRGFSLGPPWFRFWHKETPGPGRRCSACGRSATAVRSAGDHFSTPDVCTSCAWRLGQAGIYLRPGRPVRAQLRRRGRSPGR